MTVGLEEVNKITLNGDLSMVGVTMQFPLLEQYLAGLAGGLAAGPDQSRPSEIDLSGVQSIDACGCQLLAVFIRNLKKRGAGMLSFKLSADFREKIHRLGFYDELFAEECA